MTSHDDITLQEAVPVTVGDLVLDVAACGPEDGVPALLLHGFPVTRRSYAAVAPGLVEAGMRLVVPDQRGYSAGARPADVSDYQVEHLVADALGLLDALGLERVHLVGHDWGAIVAWFAAALHPDRFHSLTAISVPHPMAYAWARTHDEDQREAASYIDLLVIPGKAEELLADDDGRRLRAMFTPEVDPSLVDEYVRRLQEPGALTGALNWYRNIDRVVGGLPDVTVPTTYVWGSQDPALRRAGAERCGEFVSGDYRFVELPDVGHWIPELRPELVAEEVLRHVRRGPEDGRLP